MSAASKPVRTRVAPSPTGDPHVGTAYVALINLLFARRHGGQFLLRIEDTDQARSTLESERVILEALRWLGITWDEGPDVGGPHGPYRQSERSALYREHCDLLQQRGHAFKCFCTPARLDQMRTGQRLRGERQKYDGFCMRLSPAEIAAKQAAGEPFVVRMKVPASGTCTVQDLGRGPIEIGWDTVDMQILLKSDGLPTYHLANVVDDHYMEITHVMRGEEWISSAPKHVLLYEYFGWDMPQLFHLPLLRNADRSKLSKRKNPTSILFFKRLGYLPEAMLNFLGLFALSSAEGEEMASLDELQQRFDLSNISLGGPVFDTAKLDWLNARWIREKLSPQEFGRRVQDWALNEAYLSAIVPLAQARIERLSDLGPLCSFLFAGRLNLSEAQLLDGKLAKDQLRHALQLALWKLDGLPAWELAAIDATLRALADDVGVKFKDLVRHIYIAVTGQPASLPLFDSMALLGRDLVRERLRQALATLGGASKKEQEAWAKAIAAAATAPEGESDG